jgi:hypothetical protein
MRIRHRHFIFAGLLLGALLFVISPRSKSHRAPIVRSVTQPYFLMTFIKTNKLDLDLLTFVERDRWLTHPHETLRDLLALPEDKLYAILPWASQIMHEVNPGLAPELCLSLKENPPCVYQHIWLDAYTWSQDKAQKEQLHQKFAHSPSTTIYTDAFANMERDWEYMFSIQTDTSYQLDNNESLMFVTQLHDPSNPRAKELIKKLTEQNRISEYNKLFALKGKKYEKWDQFPTDHYTDSILPFVAKEENIPSPQEPIKEYFEASAASQFTALPGYAQSIVDSLVHQYSIRDEKNAPYLIHAYSGTLNKALSDSPDPPDQILTNLQKTHNNSEHYKKAERAFLQQWSEHNPAEASHYAQKLPRESITGDQAYTFFTSSLDHPEVAEQWIHESMSAEQKQQCYRLLERAKKRK